MSTDNKLTKEEIIHLAKLANLHLTEKEIEKYQKQLTETLDYINNLRELNTDNIEPTHNITGLQNVGFEDGSENLRKLSDSEALANTKSKKDKKFVVRRIL